MLSNDDMKELLKSREPVLHKWRISLETETIEYSCVNAVIMRYNQATGKYELTLELLDKNESSVVIANPKNVYRKGDV